MCLDKLADFEVKRNYGWQFFEKAQTGELERYFEDMSHVVAQVKYPALDEWQEDTAVGNLSIKTKRHLSYPTGFHIFVTKKAAMKESYSTCSLKKVYFKPESIVAKGYQYNNFRIIVARERYVCDKTERPPKD